MAKELLDLAPALLAWAAVAYKLPALRRSPHDPALRAYWLTLLSLALALTVLLPPVYLAVDRLAGFPNLARLLGHGSVLVTSWAVQAFLLHLNFPGDAARGQIRQLGWALAGALALMTTLFVLAPVEEEALEFMTRYADAPFIPEYWLVFLSYLGLALVNQARLSWRYASLADRVALRLGLRLAAVGGVFGLGYVAHEGLYLALRRLGLSYPLGDKDMVTRVLIAGATGLMVIGSTMPAWGPRIGLSALWRWGRRYRAYRRLYPLWLALYRSNPDIALIPPPSGLADALAVGDLGFRLYRQVIEIRDGRLALRPYLDPRAAAIARELGQEAGLSGEPLQAVIEAASLAAAIRNKAGGRPVAEAGPTLETPGGADLDSEAAFLEKVARCYTGSPIVPAVLAELGREHATPATIGRWTAQP